MLSFLLGAGASYDAQLPLATALTDRIIQSVGEREKPLLEFVRHTIQSQGFARAAFGIEEGGENSSVDSEKLYNTVNDLVNRDSLDVAPFISSWHPLLENSGQVDPEFRQRIERALTEAFKQDAFLQHRIKSLAEILDNRGGQNRFDQSLLNRMQDRVVSALAINPETSLQYLSPLNDIILKQGALHIATLNYDVVVESFLNQNSLSWSDGIGDPGKQAVRNLDFGDAAVSISKLHGSLDWFYHHSQRAIITREPDRGPGWPKPENAILFGGRNKLTVEWPFFNLLWDWRQRLDQTSALCAIGYSFRDDHVNALVLNWLGSSPDRRLIVVDPYFPDRQGWRSHVLSGYLQTNSTESRSHWVNSPGGERNHDGPPANPQLVIKRRGVEDGLREILMEMR